MSSQEMVSALANLETSALLGGRKAERELLAKLRSNMFLIDAEMDELRDRIAKLQRAPRVRK